MRMPLLPSGQQAETQPHRLLCATSFSSATCPSCIIQTLWQTHGLSASFTFHTRPPQTVAPSGPKRHMEVTHARRSRGNATNSSAWLCGETTSVLSSLNQRGHTHTPAKMRPVAGTFSAGERNRSQYLFSCFQKVPYVEGILYFLFLNNLF